MLETIKGKVIDELNERIGSEFYLCELGMDLSTYENANGSWYCSSFKAQEEIKNNFDFCDKFIEWHKITFGELLNPFKNIEEFHCILMIFAVDNIFSLALNKTEYINSWQEDFIITEEFVKAIEMALNDITMDDIF